VLDTNGYHDEDSSNDGEIEEQHEHSDCVAATIQLLKITSPCNGYIVSRLDIDYIPNYQQPDSNVPLLDVQEQEIMSWMWRVVYQPDGAFVRDGAELISDQIRILLYGSFYVVKKKVINGMGLSRLKK
jgi:hypothetical protein